MIDYKSGSSKRSFATKMGRDGNVTGRQYIGSVSFKILLGTNSTVGV